MNSKEIIVPAYLEQIVTLIIGITAKTLVRFTYVLPERYFFYEYFALLMLDKYKTTDAAQSEIAVSTVLESDLNEISILTGKNIDVLKRRLNKGDIGFVAKDTFGRCAGFKWLEIANEHYEEQYCHSIKLPPSSAWTYDHFVSPEFRNKGIWKILTDSECKFAQAHGVSSVYCYVGMFNFPSLKAQKSIGFKIIRNYVYINLFGFRLILSMPPHKGN